MARRVVCVGGYRKKLWLFTFFIPGYLNITDRTELTSQSPRAYCEILGDEGAIIIKKGA